MVVDKATMAYLQDTLRGAKNDISLMQVVFLQFLHPGGKKEVCLFPFLSQFIMIVL